MHALRAVAILSGCKLLQRTSEESDYHPLVEPLVRVDPLAGAPALDACLMEGEQASSPVEKAGALSVMLTGLC